LKHIRSQIYCCSSLKIFFVPVHTQNSAFCKNRFSAAGYAIDLRSVIFQATIGIKVEFDSINPNAARIAWAIAA
jgi:hypothetical protein